MIYEASLYKHRSTETPPVTVDVLTFLTTDKYKSLVETYRKTGKGIFPVMTIPAVCEGMHGTDSATLNGLICIDIDGANKGQNLHITNWVEFIHDLKWIEEIFFAGLSRSGHGCFIVMPLKNPTKENFIEYFRHIERWWMDNYRIKIDGSCKNISRLRYASYNTPETSWYNEMAKPWRGRLKEPEIKLSPGLSNLAGVDDEKKFNFLVKWAERTVLFEKGSGNFFTLKLSGACCRFGIPIESCVEMINERFWTTAPDYNDYVDIWTRTVKCSYKKYPLGSALIKQQL